jgi:hypothetical protein
MTWLRVLRGICIGVLYFLLGSMALWLPLAQRTAPLVLLLPLALALIGFGLLRRFYPLQTLLTMALMLLSGISATFFVRDLTELAQVLSATGLLLLVTTGIAAVRLWQFGRGQYALVMLSIVFAVGGIWFVFQAQQPLWAALWTLGALFCLQLLEYQTWVQVLHHTRPDEYVPLLSGAILLQVGVLTQLLLLRWVLSVLG